MKHICLESKFKCNIFKLLDNTQNDKESFHILIYFKKFNKEKLLGE